MALFSEFSSKIILLPQYLITRSNEDCNFNPNLVELLLNIQSSVKLIRATISDAYRFDLGGSTGLNNFQGENVKNLDQISNNIFISTFSSSKLVSLLISEENEKIIEVCDDIQGKYIICFDPLDGSSNIDCSLSIGSIFGIYYVRSCTSKCDMLNTLRKENLVATGYALYGSTTMIVLSIGSTVNGFTYSEKIGEFLLTHKNIKIPKRGNIYSINEAYEESWSEGIKYYIKSKKNKSMHSSQYSSRYIGAMVADVHRTILHGGIFIYPATRSHPQGKMENAMSYKIKNKCLEREIADTKVF
ncbi:fructose-1,6-bisphosphatase 1 isoform X2 [Chelonus insularis]|uniref:fructose-1,6-bisphosphatase 1 isoform X2 n=1 Tax=Chelonus insularis TaxID=460826 RepID=UPI00158D3242|nr:fructose-1,6-bisphosphatase 1 isoform X2 [Chelonus insularis]